MWARFKRLLNSQGRAGLVARALMGSAGLRFAGMGLGFLVGILLARGLAPAGYGVYGIAMAILSLLMIPTELGLPQLITREVAALSAQQHHDEIARLIGWSVKFVLVTSFLIATGLLAFIYSDNELLRSDLHAPLLWGCLYMVFVAVSNIASSALRGFHQMVSGQYSEILIRPSVLACSLVLVLLLYGNAKLTPSVAMALNVVAAFVGGMYAVLALRRFLKFDASQNLSGMAQKRWLASSLPLAMSDGMRIISGHLAILIMGILATREEAGVYRVALGIYTVSTLPSALINAVCSPMLSTLHQECNIQAIQRMISWIAAFLTASAIIFILPFIFSGDWIIAKVFGADYSSAAQVLLVVLAGEVASSLVGHPTVVLNMLRCEGLVVRCSVVALGVSASICILLIPKYGAMGAAIGVAISQFVWRALAAFYAKKRLGLDTTIFSFLDMQKRTKL